MDLPAASRALCPAPGLRLIVCLGNPGPRYAATRHNVGFLIASQLRLLASADVLFPWQPAAGELRCLTLYGAECFLLQPLSFMNNSGEVVKEVIEQFSFSPSELLSVSDCLDLPLGRLRLRSGGSSSGQKGIASMIEHLGCEAFPRFRIGIGRPQFPDVSIIDYVLASWTSAELSLLRQVVPVAANLVATVLGQGLAAAMNQGNGWSADNINAS